MSDSPLLPFGPDPFLPSTSTVVPFDSNQAPVFQSPTGLTARDVRRGFAEACAAWLARSPSLDTRSNYARDLRQFVAFVGLPPDDPQHLAGVLPRHVAAWRDHLRAAGLTNSSIVRKMSALRSLFSYLQTYGYTGANPANSKFVSAPAVPRDGKTVGLAPEHCRFLLDAPAPDTPVGIRDRALLALLAYTGCRVG